MEKRSAVVKAYTSIRLVELEAAERWMYLLWPLGRVRWEGLGSSWPLVALTVRVISLDIAVVSAE